MRNLRKSFLNIALLFDLGSKVNRDRFSGILRRASAIDNWEIRTYTANDLDRTLGMPASARKALWLPDGEVFTDDEKIGRCAADYFLKHKFAHFAFVATCDETERWHSALKTAAENSRTNFN